MADDVSKIIKEGEDLGLILNVSKRELITRVVLTYRAVLCVRSSVLWRRPSCWARPCLSVPILTVPGLSAVMI